MSVLYSGVFINETLSLLVFSSLKETHCVESDTKIFYSVFVLIHLTSVSFLITFYFGFALLSLVLICDVYLDILLCLIITNYNVNLCRIHHNNKSVSSLFPLV